MSLVQLVEVNLLNTSLNQPEKKNYMTKVWRGADVQAANMRPTTEDYLISKQGEDRLAIYAAVCRAVAVKHRPSLFYWSTAHWDLQHCSSAKNQYVLFQKKSHLPTKRRRVQNEPAQSACPQKCGNHSGSSSGRAKVTRQNSFFDLPGDKRVASPSRRSRNAPRPTVRKECMRRKNTATRQPV